MTRGIHKGYGPLKFRGLSAYRACLLGGIAFGLRALGTFEKGCIGIPELYGDTALDLLGMAVRPYPGEGLG